MTLKQHKLTDAMIELAELIADKAANDMPGSRFTRSDLWVAARNAALAMQSANTTGSDELVERLLMCAEQSELGRNCAATPHSCREAADRLRAIAPDTDAVERARDALLKAPNEAHYGSSNEGLERFPSTTVVTPQMAEAGMRAFGATELAGPNYTERALQAAYLAMHQASIPTEATGDDVERTAANDERIDRVARMVEKMKRQVAAGGGDAGLIEACEHVLALATQPATDTRIPINEEATGIDRVSNDQG